MSEQAAFEGWAILELMGHRKLGGRLSEQEIAGQAFIRIDVPAAEGADVATQFYSAAAVYAITPTTEDIARAVAGYHKPQPVTRWEFERGKALPAPEDDPAEPWEDDDGPPF